MVRISHLIEMGVRVLPLFRAAVTDKGPWAEQTAVELGKFHGFCTRHETNNIPAACAGQQNYDACFKDLNALIYGFASVKELEAAFVACRRKYGHLKPAAKFIDAIETDRHKLCRAYTQYIFSLNHTSTQRGEGFNDVIKGHKDLIPMLANADLVTLYDHLFRLALETDATIIKILAKLRKREKRWSDITRKRSIVRFSSALPMSKQLSTKATQRTKS